MLARLTLYLEETDLSYQKMSLFHGALMELLPPEYAEVLHQSQLHPYTQHLEKRDEGWRWIVSCLNREAAEHIIQKVLMNQQEIYIRRDDRRIRIIRKVYEEISYQELMRRFYEGYGQNYISLQFLTPTAFKQQGSYTFYPDLRCIYQSLMNKYDSAVESETMCDEETLEQLCHDSRIVEYNLRSVKYHLEGARIPSFVGRIKIKLSGTRTMADFANLLFEFGEYSGVGIKTSLGMGAIMAGDKNICRLP